MRVPPAGTIGLETVPTANGSTRLLVRLDRGSEARFRAAAPWTRIDSTMPATVVANRLLPGRRGSFQAERERWHRLISRARASGGFEIRSDVRTCFASIAPELAALALARVRADPSAVLEVLALTRSAGVEGLPAGPFESGVLANLVLSQADRAVLRAGAVVVRWVDDVVIIGQDRPTAVRAFDAWARELRAMGLSAHEGKTSAVRLDRGTRAASARPGSVPGMACYPAP